MKWKERIIYIIIILSFTLFTLKPFYKTTIDHTDIAKSDTIIIYDTIQADIPKPIIKPISHAHKKVVEKEKTIKQKATIPSHKVTDYKYNLLNEERKQYTYETTDYKAVISGIDVSLDKMTIFKPTKIITNTLKPKKFNVSIVGGYGLMGKESGMFIGIAIGYTLFTF